jgi:hypothetical protein
MPEVAEVAEVAEVDILNPVIATAEMPKQVMKNQKSKRLLKTSSVGFWSFWCFVFVCFYVQKYTKSTTDWTSLAISTKIVAKGGMITTSDNDQIDLFNQIKGFYI